MWNKVHKRRYISWIKCWVIKYKCWVMKYKCWVIKYRAGGGELRIIHFFASACHRIGSSQPTCHPNRSCSSCCCNCYCCCCYCYCCCCCCCCYCYCYCYCYQLYCSTAPLCGFTSSVKHQAMSASRACFFFNFHNMTLGNILQFDNVIQIIERDPQKWI